MYFVVPGRLDQITGGYLFDRRIVDGLRAMGREVRVIELGGRFPDADDEAAKALAAAFAAMPDGSRVVVDGLALAAAPASFAGESKRLRIVTFVHHPLALETDLSAPERDAFAALEGALLPLAAGVICPSARTALEVAAYGVAPERIAVAAPGVDRPPPSVHADSASRRCRLLCVATVTPRKGHIVLIEALARLGDLDWTLRCIGSLERDPATVAAVRDLIAARGLGPRVALCGEFPPGRMQEAYAAADLFVLPSYHEGYGMAFTEAMVHGLPIVATTAGAIPDTVPPGTGVLVPPGDPASLARALQPLIEHPSRRSELARGATLHAAALPDWNESVATWAAAFDRLTT
jgi:glycosyltransferase involved in cell wall biosynthesis